MNKAKMNYKMSGVYLLGLFFLYPVAAHIIMYEIGYLVNKLPHGHGWITVQVFLSGPVLVISGLILYFKYGQLKVNKFFGIVIILIGVYWLYTLLLDIIKEAAWFN